MAAPETQTQRKDERERTGSATLAQSASLLIALQVGTRLLTFALNQLLVRLTDPSVFGAANVQLDLLLSTILFLARDGVRGALIRSGSADAHRHKLGTLSPGLHNIALLPIPAGLVIASIATVVYTTRLAPKELSDAYPIEFLLSVGLYVLGAVFELISEPFYLRASVALNIPLRVKAEGAAVLAKGVATLAFMALPFSPSFLTGGKIGRGLVAFGLGQAAYGAATLLVFLTAHVKAHGFNAVLSALLPAPSSTSTGQPRLDPATISLTWVLVKQSLLKHLLTESDKLAVARIGSLSDQGGYALASNYGSLVARMLFQPLEESSRMIFSTQLGSLRHKNQDRTATDANANELGPALRASAGLLGSLLHFYALLAALLLAFAAPLAAPGLFLLAGPRWVASTSAPSILAAYAGIYLGVMGFNGILEGFLQATASEPELGTYSGVMVLSSAAFVGALAGLARFSTLSGETSLVYANALALALRAAWSWAYVLRFVRTASTSSSSPPASSLAGSLGPAAILPSAPTLLTLAAAGAYLRHDSYDVWRASQKWVPPPQFGTILPFMTKGAACALVCATSIAIFERRRIASTLSSLRSGRR